METTTEHSYNLLVNTEHKIALARLTSGNFAKIKKSNRMENGLRIQSEVPLKKLMDVAMFYQQDAKKIHAKKRVKPFNARFKMKIYWRDLHYSNLEKNGQIMYSYDYFYQHHNKQKIKVTDEREGLIALVNEAKRQQRNDTFISIVIWCCMDGKKETATSRYNIPVVKLVRNCNRLWFNPSIKFEKGFLELEKIFAVNNENFFRR